jgi:hypothetical protein
MARIAGAMSPDPHDRSRQSKTAALSDDPCPDLETRVAARAPVSTPPLAQNEDELMNLKGKCFCGAVGIEVSGSPVAMGYCHCSSCRSWSGGPVNAFSLWKPEAVRITSGAENVAMFQKTKVSQRQYCSKCGGHLMTNHPPFGLIDVFAATIPGLEFKPGVHVNYAETVLPMRDGYRRLSCTGRTQLKCIEQRHLD